MSQKIMGARMRYGDDYRQGELDVVGVRRRGRPASLNGGLSAAERQAARRRRQAEEGTVTLSVEISVELFDALDKFVQFKDVTKSQVVERLLRGALMRKR